MTQFNATNVSRRDAAPGAPLGADGDETEGLRVEIEQTRIEMGGTLDEIEARLRPETLKDQATDVIQEAAEQAKEVVTTAVREAGEQAREVVREATTQAKTAVHDATIGKAEDAVDNASRKVRGLGATMIDTIKQNPVPAALAGIGLGWLVFKGRSSGSSTSVQARRPAAADSVGYPYGGTDYSTDYSTGAGYQPASALYRRGGMAADGDDSGESSGMVGGAVGQVKESVGGATDRVKGVAGDVTSKAQETAERVSDQTQRFAEESPLMLGGLALAAGAVVGLLLPRTEQEDMLLGEARDRLMQQAKATAKDLQPKVQQVMDETQHTLQSATKEHLSSDRESEQPFRA